MDLWVLFLGFLNPIHKLIDIGEYTWSQIGTMFLAVRHNTFKHIGTFRVFAHQGSTRVTIAGSVVFRAGANLQIIYILLVLLMTLFSIYQVHAHFL